MGARVAQVFALQVDAGPAGLLRQALGKIERRWPADVMAQIIMELPFEFRIVAGIFVLLGELAQSEDERLRHVPAAVGAKAALSVRDGSSRRRHRCLTSGAIRL